MVGGREGRGSLEGAGFAGRGRGLQPAAAVAQAQCGPCPGAIPSVSARRGEGRAGLWRAGPGRAGPGMAEKKQPVDLGLLEEDDEFEEFPAEDWTGLDEDEDAHVWEDNWDDDNVEDDFSNQLRAELEKHGYKMETS
uniref:26S proteasome complex subunit SEM1 n=1 Tax=Anser brachyrhynchus TaxID=132585 RepID=A0A8B9I2H9_9AVES